MLHRLTIALLLPALACACGSDDETGEGSASIDEDGTVTPGPLLGDDDPVIIDPGDVGGGANSGGANGGGTGGVATGAEDSCDGVDNDGNGIIDDVDVGMDGVCDCLRIATLGEPGEWGAGNVFSSWLDARSALGAQHLGDSELTAASLADHQVIIVQNVSEIGREYTDAEVAAFRAWIEAGGGAMTLIGFADPDERTNVNRLLSPFDIQYGSEQILQRQGGATIPVTGWMTHATTDGISQIGVDNGYPVTGGATLLATEDAHDLARAAQAGAGHVFVWGDEWITYDSEWNDRPEYQVELFWVNILKWLSPQDECQVAIPPTIVRGAR